MGFWYNNKVTIERVFDVKRHIMVKWYDDVTQRWYEKKFDTTEDFEAAFAFAKDKFNETAM